MTTGIFSCLCCCCRCVPHSNAYQPAENGAPLCLVLHKSFSLAWGKKKKKKKLKKMNTWFKDLLLRLLWGSFIPYPFLCFSPRLPLLLA